jgi:GNAT superfamily N-acetyltransferase
MIHFRPGLPADTRTVFDIYYHSLADLFLRLGQATQAALAEPGRWASWWAEWQPLFEHLALTADQFWIAEQDGWAVGYARSILRGGMRELTEFFVLPGGQSAGLGRELLRRAFPVEGATRRSILATVDPRALALYLKQRVYPRTSIYTFYRPPEKRDFRSDLDIQPIAASPQAKRWLGEIDDQVLGYRREADHAWLAAQRQGYVYLRDGRPAGYGYTGGWSGPVAVLDPGDLPALLAHLESQAAALGVEEFGLDVPLANRTAVDTLLSRGFKIGSFQVFWMADEELGKPENYLITSPQFFV